jgi:threonine dehydratase
MTATAIDVHCDDVVAAMARIADGVVRTPCHESDALSELCGARIFTKAEYLQRTGSFKERGARNALLQMDPALRARGVVAASAGNHALALAYHGRDLGIAVTVVMPRGAPLVKQVRCAHYGARVLLPGYRSLAALQDIGSKPSGVLGAEAARAAAQGGAGARVC